MNSLINKKYKFVYGDIFEHIDKTNKDIDILIPHVCNNLGKFSGGFAKIFANKFPEVKINYEIASNYKLGENQKIKSGNKVFINMIAQNGEHHRGNTRPLNYFCLVKCMADIRNYVKTNYGDIDHKKCQIHCPKIGTGSSGGNWSFISDLIEDIWGDLDVFVYSHKRE